MIVRNNQLSVCKDLQDKAKKDRNFLSLLFLFSKMKIQLQEQFSDFTEIDVSLQMMLDSIME
jgi:hypothetical protein